jgi:hypothetical protein
MTDQSEHSAESTLPENPTIDATELFNAALKADQEGGWGNDGAFDADALKIAEGAKEVPSGNRAPDESGPVETQKADKAESSAEQPQEHTGHPEGAKKPGKPVIDALGREHDPVTGRLLPKKQDAQEAKPAETPYSKAKKEEERQKSVLSGFQKQKDEWEAKAAQRESEIARREQEVERFKQVPRRPDGSPHEFNSQQYTKAADDFYGRAKKALSEGDVEQSNQLLAKAEQCSQAAEQVAAAEQQQAREQSQKQYVSVWRQNMDYTLQQDPELRNPENPVAKEINAMLDTNTPEGKVWAPFFEGIPNGFGVLAQVMKWKVAAVENSALSEKLKNTEAELEKARARIGIRPAPSAGMPQPTTFDNMSDAQRRQALMEHAREEDRMPAFG